MENTNVFDKQSVLITGGLGFIGSNLAIRLVELGARVTLVDSLIPEYGGNVKNIETIKDRIVLNIADVRDPFSMNYLVKGHQFLFNLAGQTSHVDSMADPFTDLEINARAQLSMLEACRRHNHEIRVVFASTRQVYGRPQYLPVDENHPLQPTDINGIHKLAGEWYHLLFDKVYSIKSVILRLTNTYGPRMRVKDARQTFLGIWIKSLILGDEIQVYGDGRQMRDFAYVNDVVEALLLAAATPACYGKVFNVGGGEPISLEEAAKLLISLRPLKCSYKLVPFPPDRKVIDIGDYYSEDSAFRSLTKWKADNSLKDGLEKTISYFEAFAEHYF